MDIRGGIAPAATDRVPDGCGPVNRFSMMLHLAKLVFAEHDNPVPPHMQQILDDRDVMDLLGDADVENVDSSSD